MSCDVPQEPLTSSFWKLTADDGDYNLEMIPVSALREIVQGL